MPAPFVPIAIVGASCVVPGATSAAALWENVLAGVDATTDDVGATWGVDAPALLARHRGGLREGVATLRGGRVDALLDQLDLDDLALHGTPLRELDRVFSLSAHCARQALRAAGVLGDIPTRSLCVVGNLSFPTRGMAEYARGVWTGRAGGHALDRFMSGGPALAIARLLGVGEAFALDAACASSLYAIALACRRLSTGEIDFALAGAVNAADNLFLHMGFTALGALSPTGRSRPLAADADGLLPAEGCGMVALERLDDAETAGRRILGVIRGVGLSNDGRARGFLAPTRDGQVRAMQAALAQAGLGPDDVSYVELHATGTSLGDATELESTAQVYGSRSGLRVGSLKGNLGHLITAAGVAGLAKVLGALETRTLPPMRAPDVWAPAVEASGLIPVARPEPWNTPRTRIAGVSAFGFGGNNAHLLVEEYVAGSHARMPTTAAATRLSVSAVAELQPAGPATGNGVSGRTLGPIGFDPATLRFPPRELQHALAQQAAALRVALDAVDALPGGASALDPARTATVVAMGADCEVARYGLRWREPTGLGSDAVAELGSDDVIGTMPNIPANRINRQLDLRGPGFTVSAEELSSHQALRVAADLLADDALDAVIVVGVDLGAEPVHASALAAMSGAHVASRDGAGAIVVRRVAPGGQPAIETRAPERADVVCSGNAHAASGLIATVAALRTGRAHHVQSASFLGAGLAVEIVPGTALPAVGVTGDGGLRVPAHPPAVARHVVGLPHAPALPPVDAPRPASYRRVAPAPQHTGADAASSLAGAPSAHVDAAPDGRVAALAGAHAALVAAHERHVAHTQAMYAQFQQMRAALTQAAVHAAPLFAHVRSAAPVDPAHHTGSLQQAVPVAPSTATQASTPAPPTPRADLPGPKLDRAALEFMSRHAISRYFGPQFAPQDGYAIQTRMPTPPMLLCAGVLGRAGAPTSMGRGTIWTETDVTPDAWYLHEGAMPAGIMIESGQADLLLISWLGIDLVTRGERAYRLLGCDLAWSGGLPRPGDTLQYEIHVDGHARHGDVRLFFFHYDCQVAGGTRLRVRNGQAGFFTQAELDESAGVLWDAEDDAPDGVAPTLPRHAAPACRLDGNALAAVSEGRVAEVFGPTHFLCDTHTRTPTIARERMMLLGDEAFYDPVGGPWRRGYVRAVDRIAPDDWFFEGHFHNDPCMPGTLMLEGALQALALYAIGAGLTVGRDGWRFEPSPDVFYPLRCRGQVVPTSRELVYEVFVREVHDGQRPRVVADLLCTVDGLKAFHCRAMSLELAPDWPQATLPPPRVSGRRVAHIGDLATDERAMLASALGRPTDAFGALYADFAAHRRIPRLPGPPYLFISRMAEIRGAYGTRAPGSAVVAEFDIDPDAWYFDAPAFDGVPAARTMPFCVLVEAALQPCGWLASYLGGALVSDGDLLFRNLDGDGVLHDAIRPGDGRLVTRAECTRWSQSGETIIVAFDVTCEVDGRRVYDLKTVFGFFPPSALASQVGLPERPAHRAVLDSGATLHPLRSRPIVEDANTGAHDALRLLDGIAAVGDRSLRANKAVVPAEWFFKCHFFQDPVMPGSLGLEQMIQALQWALIEELDSTERGHFELEPIALGERFAWRYRGQVIPSRREVVITLDDVKLAHTADRRTARASASLWVDGLRIYETDALTVALRRRP